MRLRLVTVLFLAALAFPAQAIAWHQPASEAPPVAAEDTPFYNAGSDCYKRVEAKLNAAAQAMANGRARLAKRRAAAAAKAAKACKKTMQEAATASALGACVKPKVVKVFTHYLAAATHLGAAAQAYIDDRPAAFRRRINQFIANWNKTGVLLGKTDAMLRGQQPCS